MNIITKDGLTVTVQPNCDLTAQNIHELRDDLILLVGDFKTINIDFSHVDFIDSAGIGLLISTNNAITKLNHIMRVTNVSSDVIDMFKTMRLCSRFEVTGRI